MQLAAPPPPAQLIINCTGSGATMAIKYMDNNNKYQIVSTAITAQRSSQALAPTLAQLLAQSGLTPAQLARVGAVVGPGSFTGARLGLTVAQALAFAQPNLSIVGLSAMAGYARQLAQSGGQPFTVLLDAAGGQAYHQSFSANGSPTDPAACAPVAAALAGAVGTLYAPASLLLPQEYQPLPPLSVSTLLGLLDDPAQHLPPQPLYLKPLASQPAV
jgi:tRNA threonylcarbamoyladenosine biosynthesis protein TsaB